MSNSGNFADKWSSMFSQQQDEVIAEDSPVRESVPMQVNVVSGEKTSRFSLILKICYHFRKVIMAIPVVFLALKLALYNMQHLPEQVGIDLQASGEFARLVSRETAVTFPLMVTGLCLVLMVFSRKTVYPWLISIFSLVLPLLLLLTNIYPM